MMDESNKTGSKESYSPKAILVAIKTDRSLKSSLRLVFFFNLFILSFIHMLALNQTFDETRSVKVLVVPIGNNSLFSDHFQVVSNLRDVPFYELNRPPAASNANSAFKYFNWNDGNLLFDFLRYDRVLIGPGDLNNFQSSKRVLMIMGLINYPELGATADSIEEELEYFARRHPNILLRRIFVFNYSFDDPQAHSNVTPLYTRIKDPASLVIFPPEGTCGSNYNHNDGEGLEGIEYEDAANHAAHSMVDVHLQEVMSHAALHIVLALESQVRLCEESRLKNILPEGLPMSTLFDELDSDPSPREGLATSTMSSATGGVLSTYSTSNKSSLVSRKAASNMYKKKPSGRIHKWMGDLCMQACSPRDAYEHYVNSIVECKALNEQLWLAGAYDGLASSIILLLHMRANVEEICNKEFKSMVPSSLSSTLSGIGMNTSVDNSNNTTSESVTEKAYRLVEDRMNDAILIYSSSIVYCALEVECILRVARMFETSPVHTNKELKVLEYVLRAVAVPGFNAQQQIEVTLEGGLRCHRMGLWRKYALFLYIAALQSADNESYGVAHALMRYACNECGIHTTFDHLNPLQATSVPHSGNLGCIRAAPGTSDSVSVSAGITVTAMANNAAGATDNKLDNSGSVGATTPNTTTNNSNTAAVWASLRTSLFSTAALIADEHGDPLAATQYLVSLMQLIQEGEHTHYATRKNWLNMSSYRLFREDSTTMNSTTSNNASTNNTYHTATNNNIASGLNPASINSTTTVPKVRWENDVSASTTNTPHTPTPTAITNTTATIDASPVPRRSKSAVDYDYNYNTTTNTTNTNTNTNTNANSNATNNNYPDDFTPPPNIGNRPYSYSLSQQVNKNNISPMVSRRLDMPNTVEDAGDNNNNNNTNNNGERQKNMRRLVVPALSERLNALSHLTHTITTPRPKNVNNLHTTYTTVGNNTNKPGEFLIDRFLRTLSTQNDPGMSVNYANTANYAALNSVVSSNNTTALSNTSISEMYSAAIAADTLDAMAQLVSPSRYPLEVQEETYGLFARLSKSIVPSTTLPLPLSMYHVRPLLLIGSAKPVVVTCSALTAARRNWQLHQESVLRDSTAGSDHAQVTAIANTITTIGATQSASSSLFYDPFAAKRQKAHNLAQQHTLLYSIHTPCTLLVTLSNPLSIPVLLNAVFPVLTGVEHQVYPISVQIPPNCEQYTIELVFTPKSIGTLVIQGIQFVINNATYMLKVDKEGNYTDPTRPGPIPKRISNTTTNSNNNNTDTSNNSSVSATAASNTILTVPASIPLILSTTCSSQPPPVNIDSPILSMSSITTNKTSTFSSNTTTDKGGKSGLIATPPDEIAHLMLYPGETRLETVQLNTTHPLCMNNNKLGRDSMSSKDSTEETHIRVTLHQFAEHTTHNTKNNTNKVTHKTTSSVVLDYTGPLGSTDIVSTGLTHTTTDTNNLLHREHACQLQSCIHHLSPLPESQSNTPHKVTSLLTQLTLSFHHHPTANTTVKYVEIEIEVCNAPAKIFNAIDLLKHDHNLTVEDVKEVDSDLNLALYSRIHRLRVYLHYVPGLTATTIAPLHTSTLLPIPQYQIQSVNTSLHRVLQQHKVPVMGSNNDAIVNNEPIAAASAGGSAGTTEGNVVRLLPHEMGIVLEVLNNSEWWMIVALTKTQIEHTVRTMYHHGTVHHNNTTSSTPFGSINNIHVENVTVVKHSSLQNLSGSLLLLPPKSARSVVIQYPTHCYDTAIHNSTHLSVIDSVEAECKSLLWAAVDLSRTTFSSIGSVDSGDSAGELDYVLANLRYGDVLLDKNTPSKPTGITIGNNAGASTSIDEVTHSVPVSLHSHSQLLTKLLHFIPHITVRTHLYCRDNGVNEFTPLIKDARLGGLYSLQVCKFYDLSVDISRCISNSASSVTDLRVELCLVVIQNEVPILCKDDEKNRQPSSPGANEARSSCVITGKPYSSYVFSSSNGRSSQSTSDVELVHSDVSGNNSDSSGKLVHKLRLCFAYSGSYSVFPLVRVTTLPSSDQNTSESGNVASNLSWWTAIGSYFRVVAK